MTTRLKPQRLNRQAKPAPPASKSCLQCTLRTSSFFCDLSVEALECFERIGAIRMFPKGKKLFVEGQPSHGVFMVCQGRVRLSMAAVDGTTVLLRVIQPGELLGVSSTLSGRPHEFSAEALEWSQLYFLDRETFLRFLRQHNDACVRVNQQLAGKYSGTCERLRTLAFFRTAAARLAKALLDSTAEADAGSPGRPVMLTLDRDGLAGLVGTSRETITRLVRKLQERNILGVDGARIVVRNRDALRMLLTLPFSAGMLPLLDDKSAREPARPVMASR